MKYFPAPDSYRSPNSAGWILGYSEPYSIIDLVVASSLWGKTLPSSHCIFTMTVPHLSAANHWTTGLKLAEHHLLCFCEGCSDWCSLRQDRTDWLQYFRWGRHQPIETFVCQHWQTNPETASLPDPSGSETGSQGVGSRSGDLVDLNFSLRCSSCCEHLTPQWSQFLEEPFSTGYHCCRSFSGCECGSNCPGNAPVPVTLLS